MNSLHYLKYSMFHIVSLIALVSPLLGIYAIAPALVIGVLYLIGDVVLGDDTTTPKFKYPAILTFQLWIALPMLCAIMFTAIWSVSSDDFLGFGHWLGQVFGIDFLGLREASQYGWLFFGKVVMAGLMVGLVGTITAHELTHRTWDPISMFVGRWLLAFSFDTIFSIEHVYGHHRYVSTTEDPATAPRGRNVYHHIVASTIKGNISAWKIEQRRLKRKGQSLFGWHNKVITGHLMSVFLVACSWVIGGWSGMLFFVVTALWGKSLLEIVNFMEHYGMVRDPSTPVQPRHSWNANNRISSWVMFNLTRHSHHHAQGEVPFQDLRPFPDAPMMITGYLGTIILAMVPHVWNKLMIPKVLSWDRRYASARERELAYEANLKSGIPALVKAAKENAGFYGKTRSEAQAIAQSAQMA